LKFAGARLSTKDEGKPVVLLISDQKLPVEKWESEFDMMMDHYKKKTTRQMSPPLSG
jgi:hypothetical protein